MKYCAFLKAVNVGGHNKVNMKALKSALENHGFSHVSPYIQSGNLLYDETAEAAERIETLLSDEFDVHSKVIIRSFEELTDIIDKVPYSEDKAYVTLLSGFAESIASRPDTEDDFTFAGSHVYVYVPNGEYHKTPYSNAYIEKATGLFATTRNMKTLHAIRNLMVGE